MFGDAPFGAEPFGEETPAESSSAPGEPAGTGSLMLMGVGQAGGGAPPPEGFGVWADGVWDETIWASGVWE